jgi:hypothetical protein
MQGFIAISDDMAQLSLLHCRPLTVERLAASVMEFAKSLAKQP